VLVNAVWVGVLSVGVVAGAVALDGWLTKVQALIAERRPR
jgi:hypothetical protein